MTPLTFTDGMILIAAIVAAALLQLWFVRQLTNRVVADVNQNFREVSYALAGLTADIATVAYAMHQQPPAPLRIPPRRPRSNVIPLFQHMQAPPPPPPGDHP